MRKADELAHGCMAKAFDDEMTFVLLARDPIAPRVIREWARLRIIWGENKHTDDQICEALACADLMDVQRDSIRERIDNSKCETGPNLGLATTAELLDELRARAEVDGRLGYRTVDGDTREAVANQKYKPESK